MSELLAVDGGTPVRTAPLPRWPNPSDAAAAAVAEVVRSGRINYWTGTLTRQLEDAYAASLHRSHALAVANGTLALELALRAFGIGPGDEVVVPARTFIATASAVVAVGATPIIADVDRDSSCLTAETVSPVLGERSRAVIPVHLGGWPVDMDPLLALARRHDLIVIEDAAQAHGGAYRERSVGALGSHAAAFSFCNDKIVSTGEGGMLVLDDDEAFRRAWAYRDHGKSYDLVTESASETDSCSYRWLLGSFGSNWRFPEIAAPLALEGLRLLPAWHQVRTRNALLLAGMLETVPGLRVPLPGGDAEHAFYRLYAYVEPAQLLPDWDRDRIARAVSAEGVPIQYGTCAEIYREEAFISTGLGPGDRLPTAAALHETSLAFMVHPNLSATDIEDTATAVAKVMAVAAR